MVLQISPKQSFARTLYFDLYPYRSRVHCPFLYVCPYYHCSKVYFHSIFQCHPFCTVGVLTCRRHSHSYGYTMGTAQSDQPRGGGGQDPTGLSKVHSKDRPKAQIDDNGVQDQMVRT